MEGVGVVTVLNQPIGYLLRLFSCAAEDYSVYIWRIVGDAFKRKVFVAGMDHIVDMAHILRAGIFCADDKLLRVVHVFCRNLGNLLWHSRREEEHLAIFRHMAQYIVDVVDKTHVEHFVSLVENHGVYVAEFYDTPVDEVDEASRCGNNDLHSLAERTNLALDA